MVDRLQDMEVQVRVDQDMEDPHQDMVGHRQVMVHLRQDTADLQEAMDRWVARADLILDTPHMVVHLQVATEHHQDHMVLLLQAMEHLLTAMVALLLLDMVVPLVAATVDPLAAATVDRHLQRVVHSFHQVGSSTLIQHLAGHIIAIAPLARRSGSHRQQRQHLAQLHLDLHLDLQEHLAQLQVQLLMLLVLALGLVQAPVLVLAQVLDLVLLQLLDLVLLLDRVCLQAGSRHQILQVAGLTTSIGRLTRQDGTRHLCRLSFLTLVFSPHGLT